MLKLKVNKRYRNGYNNIVEIVKYVSNTTYPYKSEEGYEFSEDGDCDSTNPNLHLIEEILPSKVRVVFEHFEQIDQESFKTILKSKTFPKTITIDEILKWVHTIDKTRRIEHLYFTEIEEDNV